MNKKLTKISVRTNSAVDFINIDHEIQKIVTESGVMDGVCVVFVPHTTAAVTINENADPDVTRDIKKEINKIIPLNDNYAHLEGNSAAHIKCSLFGASETIIIENGKLNLGTWQSVFFCEFDGPRNRNVWIKIL